MTQHIHYKIAGNVALITLDRPPANCLNLPMSRALVDAVTRADEDQDVRCLLLQAKGRLFCAGGDLAAFERAGDRIGHEIKDLTMTVHGAISRLARMEKPVVCAIQGGVAGGGVGLALSADLVLAARSATFRLAYTTAGLVPDAGSTWLLPRLIGLRRTQDLMMTNNLLTSDEALAIGLITRVVDDDSLSDTAMALASQLASGPTRALGAVKNLLLENQGPLESQMEREARAIAKFARSMDGREGIAAFLGRRRPNFRGE